MREGIVLIGPQLSYLVQLSMALRSLERVMTIQDAPRPLDAARLEMTGKPNAAVICLTALDNVADIRAVIAAHPETRFLFLTKDSPPRAQIAHAVHQCGGETLSQKEPMVVITATLVALLTTQSASA